jgi:hypothetical protein
MGGRVSHEDVQREHDERIIGRVLEIIATVKPLPYQSLRQEITEAIRAKKYWRDYKNG